MGLSDARWFKSSRSHGGRDCVEAAHLDQGSVAVRDSKNPSGSTLIFAPGQWDAFLGAAKAGDFDPR
ncbi:DUF397 domain-containing protein [Nocardia sp. NPDC024068]|uniref:DUF397 domain-containing protein n=1 Tax=Nocardia sp. NPDC024068 TaxID=3157197 RepID=UPI00340596A7